MEPADLSERRPSIGRWTAHSQSWVVPRCRPELIAAGGRPRPSLHGPRRADKFTAALLEGGSTIASRKRMQHNATRTGTGNGACSRGVGCCDDPVNKCLKDSLFQPVE